MLNGKYTMNNPYYTEIPLCDFSNWRETIEIQVEKPDAPTQAYSLFD